jgi:hypothetical protein
MVISSGIDVRGPISTSERSGEITWKEVEARHQTDQGNGRSGIFIINYARNSQKQNPNPGISSKTKQKTKLGTQALW